MGATPREYLLNPHSPLRAASTVVSNPEMQNLQRGAAQRQSWLSN